MKEQCKAKDSGFFMKEFGDMELVCYSKSEKKDDWKICLSDEAVKHAIVFFHQLLNHPGKTRLLQGMDRFYHPNLTRLVDEFKCDACQRYKVDSKSYGKLPARDVRTAPWEQVDVDLIGPWSVQTGTGRVYEFSALTSIDRVTGLPELIRINNKTSAHIAAKFEESWLSRYPRPFACCHDNGGEFTGWEFQKLLVDFGIKDGLPLAETLLPMGSANECTNKWVMSCGHWFTVIHRGHFQMLKS